MIASERGRDRSVTTDAAVRTPMSSGGYAMTPTNVSILWPLLWETLQALTAHYGPAIDHAAEQVGIPYGEWYGWLMAAKIFEPDPVSAARLHVRAAYTNPALQEARLAKGVKLGLLTPAGKGEYHLTNTGHAAVRQLIDAAYAAMAPLHPLLDARYRAPAAAAASARGSQSGSARAAGEVVSAHCPALRSRRPCRDDAATRPVPERPGTPIGTMLISPHGSRSASPGRSGRR